MKLERKTIDLEGLELKDEGSAGTFTAYGSVFGNVDLQGEVVARGAFARSLSKGSSFPLLWQHSLDEPIGIVQAEEDERGLKIRGKLSLGVSRAKDIYELMKDGAVRSFSIGYRIIKDAWDRATGVRKLLEIDLWEISAVVFPANPRARLQTVKRLDGVASTAEEIREELRGLQDVELSDAIKEELLEFRGWLMADLQLRKSPTVRYVKELPEPRNYGEHIPFERDESVILIGADLSRDELRKTLAHEFFHDAQHWVFETLGVFVRDNLGGKLEKAEETARCYGASAWARFEESKRADAALRYAEAYKAAVRRATAEALERKRAETAAVPAACFDPWGTY